MCFVREINKIHTFLLAIPKFCVFIPFLVIN